MNSLKRRKIRQNLTTTNNKAFLKIKYLWIILIINCCKIKKDRQWQSF